MNHKMQRAAIGHTRKIQLNGPTGWATARAGFEMNGQREREREGLIAISKGRMQALLQVCMSHTAPELTLRRRREGQGVNGTPAVASGMTHLQLDPRTVLSLTAAAHTRTHTTVYPQQPFCSVAQAQT